MSWSILKSLDLYMLLKRLSNKRCLFFSLFSPSFKTPSMFFKNSLTSICIYSYGTAFPEDGLLGTIPVVFSVQSEHFPIPQDVLLWFCLFILLCIFSFLYY